MLARGRAPILTILFIWEDIVASSTVCWHVPALYGPNVHFVGNSIECYAHKTELCTRW